MMTVMTLLCGHPAGCDRPVKARRLCKKHYEILLATTDDRVVRRSKYPDFEGMVELARGKSRLELAEALGIRRESLRDYLRIRPELKAAIEAVQTQWRVTPEQARVNDLAAKKRWRENNPERVREINRRWGRNQDPEKRRRWNLYNSLRRRAAGFTKPSDEYSQILRNDPCVYCGKPGPNTLEHIVAIDRDGENNWENYASACHSCNSSKGTKDVLQFMLRRLPT